MERSFEKKNVDMNYWNITHCLQIYKKEEALDFIETLQHQQPQGIIIYSNNSVLRRIISSYVLCW